MSKGDTTRQMIIEQALDLFNTQGYQSTSLRDITEATGVQKGGIYNHFASKAQLTQEALELAIERVRQRSRAMLTNQHHTIDRIKGVVAVFASLLNDPVAAGGCPILNTTVEADDTNPALLARARQAMNEMHQYVVRCVEKGQQRGEIVADVDGAHLASVVLSTVEGAIMLSRLYTDHRHLDRAVQFLNTYLESLRTTGAST